MTNESLRDKALTLPYAPGVYVMRDKSNCVIYVGKAKKLKNRVSQYFQDHASHTLKTRTMISKIDHFDVIITDSEFEALVLECSLIKHYQPKYNILLKDDKGYPYIRISAKELYPAISIVSKVENDGAFYYGPFGSRGLTQNTLETIRLILQLPACKKKFPRDIGKDRVCLNYHMNQCAGWCQPECSHVEYQNRIEEAKMLLSGHYKTAAQQIRNQMLAAADSMEFELAAMLRDRLNAVEALGQQQTITAGSTAETDVVGFAQTEAKACFAVLHFKDGNLFDKDYEILQVQEDPKDAVSCLLKQYYLSKGAAPKNVLLPFEMDDRKLFSQLLQSQFGRKTIIRVPQRGSGADLIQLANKNALEEVKRVSSQEEKNIAVLQMLGKMLAIPTPTRMESFDISNISGADTVASMVVFEDGKPKRSAYRKFKIDDLQGQDDYGAMRQVLLRRFTHFKQDDPGFCIQPDLLLIDGGITHAKVAVDVLEDLQLYIPVVGMVKDDRHRTRALVTAQGEEVRIDNQQAIFSLIGNMQEETHRFAINYHKLLRSKRLRYSQLDKIPGIGPKRKQELLKMFKSIQAIKSASLDELERILPKNTAYAVYRYFQNGSLVQEEI